MEVVESKDFYSSIDYWFKKQYHQAKFQKTYSHVRNKFTGELINLVAFYPGRWTNNFWCFCSVHRVEHDLEVQIEKFSLFVFSPEVFAKTNKKIIFVRRSFFILDV